jgi:hypothetical protein
VIQAWEAAITVEAAHAVMVRATMTSTQEATAAWERAAVFIEEVEA